MTCDCPVYVFRSKISKAAPCGYLLKDAAPLSGEAGFGETKD